MPDREHDNASESEAALMNKTPGDACAVNGTADETAKPAQLVHRDGEVYLEGCDVPVWRLEMARRAGSSPNALIAVSPGLTRQGLDLAFAYAQEHSAEFDPLIQYHSGASVPPEEEEDDEDEATFEAELDAMFAEHAEVFRRLAQ
jgi:hypothetical protein